AERVFASVHRYLTSKLHLVVNLEKSRLVTTEELEYLGFRFVGSRATINVSQKSIHRFKHRIREIMGELGHALYPILDHRTLANPVLREGVCLQC
ncbi:MAG: hypothetical protein ACK53L_08300, partial [Pirellulaceae bacterium]